MAVLRVLLVFLAASVVWALPPIYWPSSNSNGSCAEHIGCGNLTKAFEQVQQYGSAVTLELGPGCFDLNSSRAANFTYWTGLTIRGNNTEVCCHNGSGLTFISSKNIEIYNVTFYGCEAVQLSTSRNFTENSTVISYMRLRAGLYFLSCENLAMSSVTVAKTHGIGMVIYNTSGENTFDNCYFEDNHVKEGDFPGGGGVAIEFVYCIPGDPDCGTAVAVVNVSNSTYTFTNCYFQGNEAISPGYSAHLIYPHGNQHMMAGNGGGVSVSFKGNAYNNTVIFDNCAFLYNHAEWGGGLYLLYSDQSVSNNVTVRGGLFQLNYCQFEDRDPRQATAGGGVRIHFVYYPQQLQLQSAYVARVERNTILFKGTHFAANNAYWGGALSFVSSRADPGHQNTNQLLFESCFFVGNQARIAFAVDLSVLSPDTGVGSLMKPVFTNCTFLKNRALTENIVGYQLGIGALYVNRIPAVFQGVNTFLGNVGTGLVVSDAGVHVGESSVMNFTGNSGRSGGAAAFFGSAWIVAHKNTTFSFVNNSGALEGGAIYAVHFGEHDLFLEQNCFIRYYQHTKYPDTWNATFIFRNNTVKERLNSIYVTSTLPCVWPSTEHQLTNIFQEVFCWDNWKFDKHTNCTTQVTTAPAKYKYNNNTIPKKLHSIKVFPGFVTQLDLQALNDYDQPINQTVLTVSAVHDDIAQVAPLSLYTAHDTIKMFGVPNQKTPIVVETLDPRIISVHVDVQIQTCPPGLVPFYPDAQSKLAHSCRCGDPMYFNCQQENYTATLRRDNCLTQQYFENGTVDPNTPLVVGSCPYSEKVYPLPDQADKLDKVICLPSNRTGTLCGRCRPDYGVTVNTYRFDCVECKHYTFNWLFYIAAEFLPVTLFFLIVAVFNVSATSAPMNAFVFFSQIVTVPYFQNRYPWVYGVTHKEGTIHEDLLLIVYGIWNLDFFKSVEPGFCLSPYLDTIDVLALGYLTAFYPILLIGVYYICIQLYGRNFRPIVWLWKPFRYCCYRFRRSWEPKTSIIDAFATFILLSYTKFMFVSFCLLTPMHLHNVSGNEIGNSRFYFDASVEAFHGKHLAFAVLASVVLGMFVLLPPLLLFVYPLKIFQKCIGSCRFPCHALHTFADAFQGCYKDGTTYGLEDTKDCRYFAGLYFVFRIVVLMVYISQLHPMVQCLVQQVLCALVIMLFAVVHPYKQCFYNKLDISFFTLLAVLNSLSFYNCFSVFNYQHISETVFYLNYLLMYLPLVYIIGYVTYLFLNWKNWISKWQKRLATRRYYYSEGTVISSEPSSTANETLDSSMYKYEEDMPDRLLNPQNYTRTNTYRPVGASRAFNSDSSYCPSHSSRRHYGSTQTHFSDPTQTQSQEFRKLT